jgi:hypothetical protein
MSLIRTLLLAGIASAGLATAAFSQTMHEETVQLGPNAVEHIYYSGDVAPQVAVSQGAPDGILAAMMQQQADMAAQAGQMLQQAAAMLNAPMAMPAMPMIMAASSGACVTSMSLTQIGGEQPKVTEYRSPGCGGDAPAAPVQPTELKPAYAPAMPAPKLIQARLAAPEQPPSG